MGLLKRFSIYYLLITFLLFLYLLGSFQFGAAKVLTQLLWPVIGATITGIFFDFIELKRFQKPLTPFITGLIIGLVAQFGQQPLILFAIGAFSMLIKFIVKFEGRHIFNPAAGGLFIGSLLLSSYPSWWVGGTNAWVFLIWIPILLYKMRRWTPMVGFLLPVVSTGGISVLTSASALFFISVMLIEPKTSPATIKLGLIYGVVVAIGYLIIGRFLQFDPLVPSLLIGNLTQRLLGWYI